MVIYRLGLPYYKEFDNFQFVWVTDRLRFGGCLRWFVGRGLDSSTGDNARPVRGVEDAAPLHLNFMFATKDAQRVVMKSA